MSRPMDELTREFLIESQEGLDRMERCLTDLEERPNDAALLADIFRSVHTIKGTTGFLGFKRLEKLAHAGENLLGMLREGKLAANALIITGLLQLLDGLRSILKTIDAEGLEGDGAETSLIRSTRDHAPDSAAARESLLPCGRCTFAHCCGTLRVQPARGCAHRHGFRRTRRFSSYTCAGRHRAGTRPSHQRHLGNARS